MQRHVCKNPYGLVLWVRTKPAVTSMNTSCVHPRLWDTEQKTQQPLNYFPASIYLADYIFFPLFFSCTNENCAINKRGRMRAAAATAPAVVIGAHEVGNHKPDLAWVSCQLGQPQVLGTYIKANYRSDPFNAQRRCTHKTKRMRGIERSEHVRR